MRLGPYTNPLGQKKTNEPKPVAEPVPVSFAQNGGNPGRLVKTVNDSKGESMDIYHSDTLCLCPALSLFMRVYAELMDKGWANPVVTWSHKNRVVWAQKGNKVVGGICYEYSHEHRMGWIVLSFTDPEQRGRHINQQLHKVMESDLMEIGAFRVSSLVHVENTSRMKSAERVELVPTFYRMDKWLK